MLHTDHKPLVSLKINLKLDNELSQIMFYLSQYTFKVKYVSGKDNQKADCLSRNPVLEEFESNDKLRIINLVELNEIAMDQCKLSVELFREFNIIKKNDLFFTNHKNKGKIFISTNLANRLIERVSIKFGHIGPKQIALQIFQFYFCPNLKKLISDFCHTCSICIKNKSRTPFKFGHLSQLGPASEPYEIMSLDTILVVSAVTDLPNVICIFWWIILHNSLLF